MKKLVSFRQIFWKMLFYNQPTKVCGTDTAKVVSQTHSQTWQCLKPGGTGFKSIRESWRSLCGRVRRLEENPGDTTREGTSSNSKDTIILEMPVP